MKSKFLGIETYNKEKVTVEIGRNDWAFINKVLHRKTAHPDYDECGVIDTITVNFQHGVQADIKICNGDSPYVDPVLFDDCGNELSVIEPTDTISGEFIFKWNEDFKRDGCTYNYADEYVVVIKRAKHR